MIQIDRNAETNAIQKLERRSEATVHSFTSLGDGRTNNSEP